MDQHNISTISSIPSASPTVARVVNSPPPALLQTQQEPITTTLQQSDNNNTGTKKESKPHLHPYLTAPCRLSPSSTLKYSNPTTLLESKSKPHLSPITTIASSTNNTTNHENTIDEDDIPAAGGNRKIDWKKWYGNLQEEALKTLSSQQRNELMSDQNRNHFFHSHHNQTQDHHALIADENSKSLSKELSSELSSLGILAPQEQREFTQEELQKLLLLTPEQRQQHFLQENRKQKKLNEDKQTDEAESKRLEERIEEIEGNLQSGWGDVQAKMLLYENVKNMKSRSAIQQVAELRKIQHLRDLEQKKAETERGIAKMLEENNRQKEKEKRRRIRSAGGAGVKKEESLQSLGNNNNTNKNGNEVGTTGTSSANNNNSPSTSFFIHGEQDDDESDDDDTGMTLLKEARARFHNIEQEQHDSFRTREITITERRSRLFQLKEESHRIAEQKMMISRKKEEEEQLAAEREEAREQHEAAARQERIDRIKAEDKLSAILFEERRLSRMRLEEDRLRRAADRVKVENSGRQCEEEARFRRLAADAERQEQVKEQKRMMLTLLAERGVKLKSEKDREGLLRLRQEFLDQIAEIDKELLNDGK